jgi:hypothetical protein
MQERMNPIGGTSIDGKALRLWKGNLRFKTDG